MKRFAWVLGSALLAAISIVSVAGATAAYPLSDATSGFQDELMSAISTALPIGGAVLAFFVGWKILKRVVRG
jgi:hypothetical protein